MKVTRDFLVSKNVCREGLEWYDANKSLSDPDMLCKKLLKQNHFDWANWFISKTLTTENLIRYAIFAARSVLAIFEDKFPNDDRPRRAIEAAENYLKVKTKDAAYAVDAAHDAAYAAYTAAYAVDAAHDAAYAADAADAAADAAAYAAAYAARAAYAAVDAAYDAYAADAAARAAARAAGYDVKIRMIHYGLFLLKTQGELYVHLT
jgi:hypothetical protein